jgi:hypothetical protein
VYEELPDGDAVFRKTLAQILITGEHRVGRGLLACRSERAISTSASPAMASSKLASQPLAQFRKRISLTYPIAPVAFHLGEVPK